MVNRAVAPDRVLPDALELAREMAEAAPIAVAGVKRALARSAAATLDDQLDFEAAEQARCFESRDVREGPRRCARRDGARASRVASRRNARRPARIE